MIKLSYVCKDGSIYKNKHGFLNTRIFIKSSIYEMGYGSNILFENFKKLLQFVYIEYHYHFEYEQEYKNLEDWLEKEFKNIIGINEDIFSYESYELKEKLITKKINEIQSKTVTSEKYEEYLLYYYNIHLEYFKKEKMISDLSHDRNNYNKGLLNNIFNSNELNQTTKDKITLIKKEQKQFIDIVTSKEFTMMQLRQSEIKYGKEILKEIQDRLKWIYRKKMKEEKGSLLELQNKLKIENKKKELHELKIRLETNEVEKRKMGAKLKPHIKHHGFCPYCELVFTPKIIIHLDHIHPIKLGGLERVDNLVKVCSTCNLQKSDMTLREFIKKYNLNRDKVENNLTLLNKKF